MESTKSMLIKDEELEKCEAKSGDLLVCEGGESGRAAVWDRDETICFQNHIHRVRPYGNINPYYMFRFFEKLNYSGEINNYRKGMGTSNLSGTALSLIPIPIPPHNEQKAIVSKVKQLMSCCDELEKKIEKRDSYQEKMMQAVVKQAFKKDVELME